MELYKKHRPQTLNEVVGQDSAVGMLADFLKKKRLPHSLLFTGPSGCGKTTLARVLASELECSSLDLEEINAASSRGIDTIREISRSVNITPMGGKARVIILDEAHQLTRKKNGDAQSSLLKLLEDTPRHVYFFLCTTDPSDLLKTIRTRCTEIKVGSIKDKVLFDLLESVSKKEKTDISEEVLDKIVSVSEGSARKALVILDQVIGLESEEDQLAAILACNSESQVFQLFGLFFKPKVGWLEIAKVIQGLDEEPETVRRAILTMSANKSLKGEKVERCLQILEAFECNYFDSGKAGLVLSCHRLL